MDGGMLGILVFAGVIFGVIGMLLGSSVNKVGAGFFLGFFLGPIGWIIVFLLPRETSNSPQTQTATERPSSQKKAPEEGPPRDLTSDAYKIYLGKKYEITRNELFDKFEFDGKLFESLEAALKYADELEAEAEAEAKIEAERAELAKDDLSKMTDSDIRNKFKEKNILMTTPMWKGGYKIIDQDGKEQRFETYPQLAEYYGKVFDL